MPKVLVYVTHGIGMDVLQKVFLQVEGTMRIVTFHETVEDSMIEHYARKNKIPCVSFPKETGVLRGMELLEYCDGFLLIGDDPKLRWLLKAGSMMKRNMAWFNEKGLLNQYTS